MAARVELFACEGALSDADEHLRFFFRAYADTSLGVRVERIDGSAIEAEADESEAQAAFVHSEEQGDGPRTHGSDVQALHTDVDDSERSLEEQQHEHDDAVDMEQHRDDEMLEGNDAADDEDEDAEADDDNGGHEYVAFDGSCTKQFDPEQNNEYFYVVRFKLVRWQRHNFASTSIHCVGHLSAREGFRGEFVSLDATDITSLRHGFHIPLAVRNEEKDEAAASSSHRIETLSDQLYPLTPGEYELSGYTIAENGYVYRCLVHLVLHPSGDLTGSSQELLFPQVCEIVGTWSRVELSYTLRYTMDDRVSAYIYHCSPFLGSTRGWWQNMDIDAQRHNSERGCLEFTLSRSRRHWSEQMHSEYPLAFRKCIKSLLLVSLRSGESVAPSGYKYALPSHLWTQVFAFCDYHWFRDDDDDEGTKSEKAKAARRQHQAEDWQWTSRTSSMRYDNFSTNRKDSRDDTHSLNGAAPIFNTQKAATTMTWRHCLKDETYSSSDEQYVLVPLPEAPAPREPPAFSCEYEGAISGNASVFRLRVLHDATLEGEVLKPRVARDNTGEEKKQKRPKLTTTMTRLRVQETRSMTATRDELVVSAHLQGRVKPLSPGKEAAARLRIDDTYCCYFDILPDSKQSGDAVTCHVHLTPSDESGDLKGQWVLHLEKPFWITRDAPCELYYQEIKQHFQLKRRIGTTVRSEQVSTPIVVKHEYHHVAVKTEGEDPNQKQGQLNVDNRLKLYPLTPGLYEFRGFTTIAPPPTSRPSRTMTTSSRASPSRRRRRSSSITQPAALSKDECFVTLRLLPDGTVKGTSRELLRPQSCPVSGTWRIDRVRYVLEYKVRDAVGLFRYSGRIEGDHKILGKWQNVDEGHQEGYNGGKGDFELELTQAVRQSVVKKEKRDRGGNGGSEVIVIADDEDDVSFVTKNKIHALTTGQYTLKGCATDDDGYEYACELIVNLFSGGTLKGFSRELIFDQTHPIEGKWSSQCMSYDQKYIVKGDVGEYNYNGAIDSEGGIISGVWENAEPQDKETRGEKGTFAYGIVDAHRVWSAFSHRQYPTTFQDGVMLILLWSSRTHTLPNSLWFRVFEFCRESWFAVAKK